MRKLILPGIVLVVLITLALFGRAKFSERTFQIKTYVENAQSLKPGARVDLAGVQVGTVLSVRPRPELKPNPVEVVMAVSTPYELKIPSDATVTLEQAGVLGGTFVAIDVQGASGPTLAAGGVLKAKHSDSPTVQELVAKLQELSKQKNCAPQTKEPAAPTPTK
jgi:phospholipid/cholesterol/gamma-HCH transport system substrate-binding protein